MDNATTILIRSDGEYGRFFFCEQEFALEDGSPRHAATWCCVSSFGVYGYHWSHMSRPFSEFVQGVSTDYLLGKISRKVTSAEKTIASVRRAVLESRRNRRCSKDEAREAWDEIAGIEVDGWDAAVPHMLWESAELSRCRIEWCDLSTQEWDQQAVMFATKLWPLFVKQLAEVSHAQ